MLRSYLHSCQCCLRHRSDMRTEVACNRSHVSLYRRHAGGKDCDVSSCRQKYVLICRRSMSQVLRRHISSRIKGHVWSVETENICSVTVSFVWVGSQISPRRARKYSDIPSPGRTRSVKCFTPGPSKTIISPPHVLPVPRPLISWLLSIFTLARWIAPQFQCN